MYTNLVLTNPHDSTAPQTHHHSTYPSTAPTTPLATAQTSAFQWGPSDRSANSTQEYTTTSLTSPLKGVIPSLMREESHSIPIPGRAQSHDDIRMIGVGSNNNICYGSPRSNYCFSPISPTGQYTCNSPINLSPPVNYYSGNQLHVGGTMVARRALSRAASPLSNSVPTGVQYSSSPSSCRTNAVKNCSRSDQKKKEKRKKNKFISKMPSHLLLFRFIIIISMVWAAILSILRQFQIFFAFLFASLLIKTNISNFLFLLIYCIPHNAQLPSAWAGFILI